MTEALRAIAGWGLRLAAAVAALAMTASPAVGKDRSAQKITWQTLDALARKYRDAGLPLPPPDAPLMLYHYELGDTISDRPFGVIGFALAADEKNGHGERFLMGTQTGDPGPVDPRNHLPRSIDPSKGLPADVRLVEGWQSGPGLFPTNNWMALALQCHLRGYDRLAEQIFARGLARNKSTGQTLTRSGDGNPRDALAATAWNHWMNTLLTVNSDRREILAHLEKLSTEFPALDGPFQRDYLASLRLTLVPGKAPPESVEAAIDSLVDHTGDTVNAADTDDLNYARLLDLGFGAVPALIAHLDDRRLTRSVANHDADVSSYPRRVNELVSDLIESIAGAEEFPHGGNERKPGQPADKEAVGRWWAKASAMGEEAYMTRRLFPPDEISLQIVSERYPQHLGEIYTRLLQERPEAEGSSVATAIGTNGQIATEERRRLLHLGLASPHLQRNVEAIGVLAELDRADADAALIEKLGHWPTTTAGPYNAIRPESLISVHVMASDSAEVWQTYERALFRADAALRMEMLEWLTRGGGGTSQNVRRLALLDLFLDDEETRVVRKEDEAPGGRFEGYPVSADDRKVSVRDFVTRLLGNMLDVKPPPGSEHNERWWAKYRANARAAIDQQTRAAAEAPVEMP